MTVTILNLSVASDDLALMGPEQLQSELARLDAMSPSELKEYASEIGRIQLHNAAHRRRVLLSDYAKITATRSCEVLRGDPLEFVEGIDRLLTTIRHKLINPS